MAQVLDKKNILIFFMLTLILSIALPLGAQSVERIVATVNGDVITLKQVEKRANGIIKANRLGGAAAKEIKDKILDALIEQELVSQEARKKGIFVSDGEINEAVEEMKKLNNINQSQFEQALAYQGMDLQSFRDDIKLEILKNKVLGLLIISRIVVTDNEVNAYLRGEGPKIDSGFSLPDFSNLNAKTPKDNSNLGVKIIIFEVSSKNKGAVRSQADKVRNEIVSGKISFGEAAKKYSQGPGKDDGGRMGVLVKELQPELRTVLMGLTPGEISDVIDAGNAILLAEIISADVFSEETKNKDSFSEAEKKQARAQLEDIKRRQRYHDWLEDIKNKATIRKNL